MNIWHYLGLGSLIVVTSAQSVHWFNYVLLAMYVLFGVVGEYRK